jgi:hypothetical protein
VRPTAGGAVVDRRADPLWLCFGLRARWTLAGERGWTWDAVEQQLTTLATGLLPRP